jgi:hypothetical protein
MLSPQSEAVEPGLGQLTTWMGQVEQPIANCYLLIADDLLPSEHMYDDRHLHQTVKLIHANHRQPMRTQ